MKFPFKWCSLFVFFILGIVLSVHRFAASEYTLWYLQTLHIHNTEQICFQLFVTLGILLIIELENNTTIENIVTEDMKYHEMTVFHILLQSVVLCKHWNWCSVIQCFSYSDTNGHVCYCHHFASAVCPSLSWLIFHILMVFSETTGTYEVKLCRNDVCNVPRVILFPSPETYESSLVLQTQKNHQFLQ